jgi:hypothetical protein
MTRRWPDSLPVPVGRGYGLKLTDAGRRTEFEVATRARRITATRRDRPTIAARVSDAEMAALRAWWGDEAWSLAGHSDSIADWTLTGATVTADGAVGPDEVLCDVLVENGATGAHAATRVLDTGGWVAGDSCTCVVSLAPLLRTSARIGIHGRDNVLRSADLDLSIGALSNLTSGVTATTKDMGSWTRLVLTAPVGSGATAVALKVAGLASGAASYAGGNAPALAVGQVNARRGGAKEGIFLPTASDGSALGTDGGTAWFWVPLALGGGITRRQALPLGALSADPQPSLAWIVSAPLVTRDV